MGWACHEQHGLVLGEMVFHIVNRGGACVQLSEKSADYDSFEGVVREMRGQSPMRMSA